MDKPEIVGRRPIPAIASAGGGSKYSDLVSELLSAWEAREAVELKHHVNYSAVREILHRRTGTALRNRFKLRYTKGWPALVWLEEVKGNVA